MPAINDPGEQYGAYAATYERVRPSYPARAITYLERELGIGPDATVVDVAAGTGKLARTLLRPGRHIIAVEPVPEMLEELARIAPSVQALAGSAEHLPLPSSSADAIVVGQAFHWFDGPQALAEFHRVLRPGSSIALVFNRRDVSSVDWVRELVEIGREYRPVPLRNSDAWRALFEHSALFSALTVRRFRHTQPVTHQMMVERKAAYGFVNKLPPEQREEVLERTRRFLQTHPSTRDRDLVEFPYRTLVYCSRRLG